MTVSAFVFNTSEFMPIGLLTDIAADFRMSEARAGFVITIYAWAVMLLSLPLMVLASRIDLRRLLLGVVILFGVSQVLSAVSQSFFMLTCSRVGVACAHAVFWSIATPMAVRVVPERHRPLAMGMIITGTSVAMIFGLPLGRAVGLYVGWRATFLSIACVAFSAAVYLFFVMPKVVGGVPFRFRQVPELFKNRMLVAVFAMSLSVSAAYYTAYSYIEPFLKQVAEMSEDGITATLSLFGASGLVGGLLFSRYYERNRGRFAVCMTSIVAAALLLLYPASFVPWAVVVLCAFWGMAATAFNVAFQAETIRATSVGAATVAMSIFSGIFNLGIGCGTWLGGEVCERVSMSSIGFAGGVIAVCAAVYCAKIVVPLMGMRAEK